MRLGTGFLTVLLLTGAGTLVGAKMRGLLVLGHEARSLQLCGDTRVLLARRVSVDAEVKAGVNRPDNKLLIHLWVSCYSASGSGHHFVIKEKIWINTLQNSSVHSGLF